jgi:hypothetical protein
MFASNVDAHKRAQNGGDVDPTEVYLCDSRRGQAYFTNVLGRNAQMSKG